MTVPVPSQLVYSDSGDGVTTTFSFPVRFLDKAEVVVLLRDVATGVDTKQVLGSDYTIAGSSWPTGGNIVFNAAPPVGTEVIRYRETAAKQVVDLANTQRNDAEAVETQLDRLAMAQQDQKQELARAVKFPVGEDGLTIEPVPEGHFWKAGADGRMVDGGSVDDIINAQGYAAEAKDAQAAAEAAQQGAEDAADRAELAAQDVEGVGIVVDNLPAILAAPDFASSAQQAASDAGDMRDQAADYASSAHQSVVHAGEMRDQAAAFAATAEQMADNFMAASEGTFVQLTWVDGLQSIVGTAEGQVARIIGPNPGVHTDPVTGEVVSNVGEYIWSTSPAGWRRIGDLPPPLGDLATLDNVPPAKLPVRDWSNIYPDPDMADGSMYYGTAFTVAKPTLGSIPATRVSENVIWFVNDTAAQEVFTPAWPVEAGQPYALSARLGRITGTGAATTRLMVHWYSNFEGTDLISSQQVGVDQTGTAPATFSGTLTAPSSAVRARFSAQKDPSAGAIRVALFDPIVRRAITADLISITPEPYTPPTVSAVGAISVQLPISSMLDPTTVFSKNPDTELWPASLTKILTTITALDVAARFSLDTDFELVMETSDAASGSGNNITAGDRFSFKDAIANMMLPSSNVTANVVARTFGQLLVDDEGGSGSAVTRFLQEMNAKAADLGMVNSIFLNPHGLPVSGQVTTARDISLLMIEATKWEALLSIWGLPSYTMTISGPNARSQEITSSVTMITDSDVLGGKTGTITPNDYNLAIYSEAPNGNKLVTVVLRAPSASDRYVDMRAILDAVKNGYDWPLLTPQAR